MLTVFVCAFVSKLLLFVMKRRTREPHVADSILPASHHNHHYWCIWQWRHYRSHLCYTLHDVSIEHAHRVARLLRLSQLHRQLCSTLTKHNMVKKSNASTEYPHRRGASVQPATRLLLLPSYTLPPLHEH